MAYFLLSIGLPIPPPLSISVGLLQLQGCVYRTPAGHHAVSCSQCCLVFTQILSQRTDVLGSATKSKAVSSICLHIFVEGKVSGSTSGFEDLDQKAYPYTEPKTASLNVTCFVFHSWRYVENSNSTISYPLETLSHTLPPSSASNLSPHLTACEDFLKHLVDSGKQLRLVYYFLLIPNIFKSPFLCLKFKISQNWWWFFL